MDVRYGQTPVFIGNPAEPDHPVISVDQGDVHLDAHDPEHVVRVKHTTGDGVDVFAVFDKATGAKTMWIDSDDKVHADSYITTNGTDLVTQGQNHQSYITVHEAQLQAATHLDDGTQGYLVQRSQPNGTEINNLHVVASSANYTKTFPPAGLYFTEGTCGESLNIINDANVRFFPYDTAGNQIATRTFSFGRAVPLQGETAETADEKRDGLLIEDEATNHSAEIMCSNSLPSLRLIGSKATVTSNGFTEPVCPVIDVQDGTGMSRFAVFDDGFVVQRGHTDTDPDALSSGHFSSVLVSDASLHVGSCRLSYDRSARCLHFKTLKEAVPAFLQGHGVSAAPSGHTLASMTVHGWVAYARQLLSNDRLEVHDVFPDANVQDWEDSAVRANELRTDSVRAEDGSRLRRINAKALLGAAESVWLGDKLHITDTGGRAQMQIRNETIPVYLAALGVTASTVQALGTTVAAATLDQWVLLSVAAGGSDDLSVIFPVANQAQDFELRTIVNELLVKPQDATANAGITIQQVAGGHPVLDFVGNATGHGLIQFNEGANAKSLIYKSAVDKHLHLDNFDTGGKVQIEATALDLGANCALTRQGVSIEGGGASAEVTELIFVDASYGGGGSDGSVLKPYTTLSAALTAVVQEGSTVPYVLRLMPGTYTGAISHDMTNATQSISICGSGPDSTFIESGSTFAAGRASDALYFRDFASVTLRDCTVRNCKYGFYPRNCGSCTIDNVHFVNCGSAGVANRHDLSASKADQATYWASTSCSNGGATRVRSCDTVFIRDCCVSFSARGLRIQDSGTADTTSMVCNCKVSKTLESAIYCASGSYDGNSAYGCTNFMISGNQIGPDVYNCGIMLIGGSSCTVQGNNIMQIANSGLQQWHGLDNRFVQNNLFDVNKLSHNGIGSDGDAWAGVHVDGSTNIASGGTYVCVVQNNSILKVGQGRAAAVYAVRLGSDAQDTLSGYPSGSDKAVVDGNYTDAAVPLYNPGSLTETSTAESSGGGGDLGSAATVTNASGTASMLIQSTDSAVADNQIQFTIDLDRGGTNDALDYKYQFWNDGHALTFTQWQHAGAANQIQRELIRYCAGGQLLLSGGKYANSSSFDGGGNLDSIRLLGQTRLYHNCVFQTGASFSQYQPTSATDATLPVGSFKTLDDALYFRTSGGTWKKSILSDYGASAPPAAPSLGVFDSSNKPASWTSLANGSHHLVLGNASASQSAQTYRFTLPSAPSDGDCIELTNLALVHFRLPSTGTTTLYLAVADSGTCDISNTKDLRFNANYRGYNRITFTSTPNNPAQKRWIATSGELV